MIRTSAAVSIMQKAVFQRVEGLSLSPLDTSARPATFLAQLPNGRQLQVSEAIYHLLNCLSTPKSLDQLVAEFRQQSGLAFSEAQLRRVIDEFLIPNQLLHGAEQPLSRPNATPSVVALHLQRDLLAPRYLLPITRHLTRFFWPPLVLLLLVLIALAHVVVYSSLGMHPHRQAFETVPQLYMLFIASIIFHELGHLSACRYWGGTHGALGVGMYFLSPVFYSDVSAAWKLPRWQRMVVDSAGVYFQQICAIPCALLYLWTRDPIYLWVVVAIDVGMLINLNPLVKFDGYWLLSDALGVPNLHQRVGEIISMAIVWCARRLGLSPKPVQVSPFLQNLNRWTYLAVVGYALTCLVGIVLLIVFIGPLLLQLMVALPGELFVTLQQFWNALMGQAFTDLLAVTGKLIWILLVVLNIAVLLLRPLWRRLLPLRMKVAQ